MSIIDAYDGNGEAIINPWQIITPAEGFPKVAVAAFGHKFIDALHRLYQPVQIDELIACVGVPIYKISYGGKDIAVYGSTLGGPAAVGLMEEMLAKGCVKLVFFGSCGVLDRKLDETALIVPTSAYRDEGTSYHYAPPGDYIEVPTAHKLAAIFSELGLSYVMGKTWTTDAIFRETRNNMEKRRNEGCITVEMECASIMAAALFRDADVYQFLYAADNLDGSEWDARVLGSLPQDDHEAFLRIALETAIRV